MVTWDWDNDAGVRDMTAKFVLGKNTVPGPVKMNNTNNFGTQTPAVANNPGNGIVNAPKPAGGTYGPKTYQNDGNGNIAVRAALNAADIDNSRIGWQDGNVMVDGVAFKPASVKDGVSYANANDVYGIINQAYRNQNDELVRIADYTSGTGVSIQPRYENGRVYLGGREVPYAYIQNGRAYVSKKVLDGIYKELARDAGIKPPDSAYEMWQRDSDKLSDRLSDIENAKFEYNIKDDPAYQAYADMYRREGERAYREAAAQMAALNGGNMTSMAQSAANQQLNYYMSQLGDRIPELQQNAYNRFAQDQNVRMQAYDRLKGMADDNYNRRQYADELARNQYLEGYGEQKARDAEARVAAAENIKNDTAILEQQGVALQNDAQGLENMGTATQVAQTQGGYTDYTREAAGVPEDWDAFKGIYKLNDEDIRVYSSKLSLEQANTLAQMAAEYGYNVELKKLDLMNDKELARLKSDLDIITYSAKDGIDTASYKEKVLEDLNFYKAKDEYDWQNTQERAEKQTEIEATRAGEIAVAKGDKRKGENTDNDFYD